MAQPLRIVPAIEKEIGTAQGYGLGSWLWDESEENAAWQWPQSIRTVDQMRPDGQINAVMRAIIWPLLNAQWHLDCTGVRDEVAQLCSEDLDLPILGQDRPRPLRTRGRFSWLEHLTEATLMFYYGHMAFEQVYRIDEQGRARLRKLAPRMPITISKITLADDGGLESISQYRRGSAGDPIVIPVDRLVWYCHGKEGGNWQGRSLLRPAYADWMFKDRLRRVNGITLERNGMGIPTVEAAPGSNKDDIEKAQALASSIRVGEQAGIGHPNGMTVRLKGVEGTLPDALPTLRYHDEAIARSVLAQFLQLGQTHSGSRALGSTFIDFFKLFLQAAAKVIADTATQHVVEDLVDLNFGETEPAPRVVVSQVDIDALATPEQLAALFDVGALRPDDPTESSLRERFHLPTMDPASRHDIPRTGSVSVTETTGQAGVVAASARPRSPRSRRVSAAAGDDEPSDPTSLPEPLGTIYERRIDLEAKHNELLAEALKTLATAADLTGVAVAAGVVAADSTQPTEPDPRIAAAEAAAVEALGAASAGVGLRDTAHDALVDGYAEGTAGARQLVSVTSGQVGIDLEALAVDFADAVAAAEDLDWLWTQADQWIADHIGVVSRAMGRAVAEALESGASRADLLRDLTAITEDAEAAAVLYDHALATAVDEGARTMYESEGLAELEVMTAGDSRVDAICQVFDDHGPYALAEAPALPAHIGCRCALAPSDDAIRQLLHG